VILLKLNVEVLVTKTQKSAGSLGMVGPQSRRVGPPGLPG